MIVYSEGDLFLTWIEETVNICKTADESNIIITAPSIRFEIKLDLSRTSKAMTTLEVDIDPNDGINHTNTEY